MERPLLETKLHVPRRRRGLVARPRLLERLSLQAESELTLVSAPAGFGKTTLLAEWLAAVAADGRSVAWLSLDKGDSDPVLFWTYLIGALQTAAEGVGGRALSLLQSSQPPIETVLATLLNDLSALPNDVVLVLDDYHVIDAGDVRDDVAAFIADFAGDDRYIVDYLAEEVLARQPEHVQHFLLQTSVLDRLTGPLCDAVTGQEGGKAKLAALERGNLLLVPLDDRRRWYRYHQLFADVLRARLLDGQPDDVPELNRRASAWYEQNGEPSEAIRHALAAGDVERAADLVELVIPDLRRSRQEATIRSWLEAIPDDVVRVRPVLAVGYIGALMSSGEFEGVEDRLQHVEGWLEHTSDHASTWMPPAGTVVVDYGEFQRLPGVIQMYHAALALVRGDGPATIDHAQRAIDRAAEQDHLTRAGASALIGLALWGGGDLEDAHRAYSVCVEGMRRTGHIADVLGCSITLADIRITQGRLSEALRTYEQALRLASNHDGTMLRGTADMYVRMSQIACERNDLPAATRQLLRAEELGEHTWLPQNSYRWRVAMARVREAEGDLDGALDLLDAALRVYMGDFAPNVRPIPALRARVLTAQGRVGEALTWAREQGLSAEDDLSYLREFEHITLARALLALYRAQRAASPVHDAARLLQRLLQAAEAGERSGSVIEILVLQALTDQARGDVPGALAALERALIMAESEGYVRIFVGEGPPMASLLRRAAKQGIAPSYVRRLLAAVNESEDTPVRQGLIEPLSERELDVLRLLGTELDGPDIARELTVSLNTMRTHTKSIYAKLGVNNRRAAVRRAAELGLLSRSRDR